MQVIVMGTALQALLIFKAPWTPLGKGNCAQSSPYIISLTWPGISRALCKSRGLRQFLVHGVLT